MSAIFKRKLKLSATFLVCLLTISDLLLAQEKHQPEKEMERRHSVSFSVSHSHVSQGSKEGQGKWLVLPSYGFDYNYKLSPVWSLGIHNDVVIETFKVLKSDGENELKRTRPFVNSLTSGFKPGKHFTYQFGLGGEFSQEEHFFLTRLGIEYEYEVSKKTEVFSNLVYDVKWKNYNSYVFGIGLTRKL